MTPPLSPHGSPRPSTGAASVLPLLLLLPSLLASPQGGGGRQPLAGAGGPHGPRPAGSSALAAPLGTVSVPLPSNLDEFVADFDAAVRLGKALFWDVQTGSDGKTACASCHYNAGADTRIKNQVDPGQDGEFEALLLGHGPNSTLHAADFPFTLREDPNDEQSALLRDRDDRVTSSGVTARMFTGVVPGLGEEGGLVIGDPTWNVGQVNVDRSEPRNALSVINAVFNHRQFWDGRADEVFNGASIWGPRDAGAVVYEDQAGVLAPVQVQIDRASLASQALGPPLSKFEMSWRGKSFPDLGHKLLSARPLAGQLIDPSDVHLGPWSAHPERGMHAGLTYQDLIEAAFHPRWWQASGAVNGHTHAELNFSLFWGLAILCYESQLVSDQSPFDAFLAGDASALSEEAHRGMQLFYDLKVGCFVCHSGPEVAGGTWTQLLDPLEGAGGAVERMATAYSGQQATFTISTLPSPSSPFLDLDPRGRSLVVRDPSGGLLAQGHVPGGPGSCTEDRLHLILDPGPAFPPMPPNPPGVVLDEVPLELALDLRVHGQALPGGGCYLDLTVLYDAAPLLDMPAGSYAIELDGVPIGELAVGEPVPNMVYDIGYYNLGLRPTEEDLGVGAGTPLGPLSISKRLQQGDPLVAHLDIPAVRGPVHGGDLLAIRGAFRAPTLRNIALTGPYFHSGGAATLEQVVQFYARGSDFANVPDRDAGMNGIPALRGNAAAQRDLVAFLEALTDPRVEARSGVFSAPSLPLKVGHVGDHLWVQNSGLNEGVHEMVELPATGAAGGLPARTFVSGLETGLVRLFDGRTELEEEGDLGCGLLGTSLDGERRFGVVLASQPSAEVTIPFTLDDPSAAELDRTELRFTPEDWFHPQWVRLTGTQDGDLDGDQVVQLQPQPSVSADPAFDGHLLEGATFTVHDTSADADILFVDPSAGAGFANGSRDWPYPTLQAALDCAPDGARIQLADGVHLTGGASISGRSVELVSSGGAILQGSGPGPVLTIQGAEASGTLLEGLTLTGGLGQIAGLLVTDGAAVELVDCSLEANTGQLAGGLMVRNGASVLLEECDLRDNIAAQGAGIHAEGGSVTLVDCKLRGNQAYQRGGGVLARNGAVVELLECEVRDNLAPRGAGLYLEGGSMLVDHSRIRGNEASQQGGGAFLMNSATLLLVRSKLTNNSAPQGGGAYLEGGAVDALCATLANNEGAQLHLHNSAQVHLRSSILFGDDEGSITRSFSHLVLGTVDHSVTDFTEWDPSAGSPILGDPLFDDGDLGNHAVGSGSPAIDAGDPALGSDPDGSAPDAGSHPHLGD